MEEYWDVFAHETFTSRLCDRVLCATDTPDTVLHLMIGILNLDGSDYNDSKVKVVNALNGLISGGRMKYEPFFDLGGLQAIENLISGVALPFLVNLLDLVILLCARSAHALEFLTDKGLVNTLRMILNKSADNIDEDVALGVVGVLRVVASALNSRQLTNSVVAENLIEFFSSRVVDWLSPTHDPSLRIDAVSLFDTLASGSESACVSLHKQLMGKMKPTIIDELLSESQTSVANEVPSYILSLISKTTFGKTLPWSEGSISSLVSTIKLLLQTIFAQRRTILVYDSNRPTMKRPAWSVKHLVKQEGALWSLCETASNVVAVTRHSNVFIDSGGLAVLEGVLSLLGCLEHQDPSTSAARTISSLYTNGIALSRSGRVSVSLPPLSDPFKITGFDRCARFVRRQHDFMSHMMQIWKCVIQGANPTQNLSLLEEATSSLVAYVTRVTEATVQMSSRSDRNLKCMVEASDETVAQALSLLVLVFTKHSFNDTQPNELEKAIAGCVALIKHVPGSGSQTTNFAFQIVATLCGQSRSSCKTFAGLGGIQLLAPMVREWTHESQYCLATEIVSNMLTNFRGATIPILVEEQLVQTLTTSLKQMIKKRGMSLYYESAVHTLECIRLIAEDEWGCADGARDLHACLEEVTSATLKLVGFDSTRTSAAGLRTLSALLKFEREPVKSLIFKDADVIAAKLDECMCGDTCYPLVDILRGRSTGNEDSKRRRVGTSNEHRLARFHKRSQSGSDSESESPLDCIEEDPGATEDPENSPGDRAESVAGSFFG